MRIICAPDTFKESLSARQAALAMREGIERAATSTGFSPGECEVDLCPIADGGDGTVEALITANQGEYRDSTVIGPLGEERTAGWGIFVNNENSSDECGRLTAVVETSSTSGLALISDRRQRNPLHTTTFGLGQLIRAALDEPLGVTRLIIGLGGSATCDGGAGVAQALGARFHLEGDRGCLQRPIMGGDLSHLAGIDLSMLDVTSKGTGLEIEMIAACDVTNPLLGPEGSARVYGPQKGASPADVAELERGLTRLTTFFPNADSSFPGAGAAGGLGYGLVTFLNARLERGIDMILRAVHFDQRLARADLVLTGEGRLDSQSLRYHKAVLGVADASRRSGIPVIALVGSNALKEDSSLTPGERTMVAQSFEAIHSLVDIAISPEDARINAAGYLAKLTQMAVTAYFQKNYRTA